MLYLIIGCIAFILFILADVNKLKTIHPVLHALFGLGLLLLLWSTIQIVRINPADFILPGPWQTTCAILATVSLGFQLYVLFFAIPFDKTYVTLGNNKIVDTGFFALARHPGVIWFFFFFVFLWLYSGRMLILWAGLAWTAMDILHVFIQDRFIFPRMFDGYDVYIKKVPFMIPTIHSIRNGLKRKI